MNRLTIVTDRRGKLIGAVQGHELSQKIAGIQATVSFESGHKLHEVTADVDLTDIADPTELQKALAKLVPKSVKKTKPSARKGR